MNIVVTFLQLTDLVFLARLQRYRPQLLVEKACRDKSQPFFFHRRTVHQILTVLRQVQSVTAVTSQIYGHFYPCLRLPRGCGIGGKIVVPQSTVPNIQKPIIAIPDRKRALGDTPLALMRVQPDGLFFLSDGIEDSLLQMDGRTVPILTSVLEHFLRGIGRLFHNAESMPQLVARRSLPDIPNGLILKRQKGHCIRAASGEQRLPVAILIALDGIVIRADGMDGKAHICRIVQIRQQEAILILAQRLQILHFTIPVCLHFLPHTQFRGRVSGISHPDHINIRGFLGTGYCGKQQ